MKALMTIWLSAMLLLFSSLAQANLTIEITRGSDRATPIAIVPFSADGESLPEDVAQIISDNLERSGYFAPLPRNAMYDRPSSGDEVRYGQWRAGRALSGSGSGQPWG